MPLDLTGYHLTYDDEFNGFQWSPDGSVGYKTTFYFGGRSLPSNGELQYYSDPSVGVNPFSLSNGALAITASPGWNPEGLAYNSGLVTTEGSFSQQYGYFEARVQAAQGAGMWNGIWMLPTSKAWPPEIDIMEAFGADNGRGEGGAYQNHVNAITHATGGGGDWVHTPFNIYEGYHTYGVNWQPDTTTFYMDGQEVYKTTTPSDMHSPMYMLVQLAVGGPWVGNPNGGSGQIKVDYIRAYSNDAGKAVVALDTISSPDGADTSFLYGAAAANGTPSPNPGGGSNAGTGPDTLTIRVSEDAWNGHAMFTALVDGKQVGGTQTTTALHGAGQWQDITLTGTFGTGPHDVAINFINDAWGGTTTTDRNLYVQSVALNGETIQGTSAINDAANGHVVSGATAMDINGTALFHLTGAGSHPGTGGTATPTGDTLYLRVSEDAWNGHAQFTVSVDGHQVGNTHTASASHGAGQWQDIALTGDFGAGPHTVDINFINDGWGGTAATDRNLYVHAVGLNGEIVMGNHAFWNTAANGGASADPSTAVMQINGTSEFKLTGTSTTSLPTTSTITLHVAEDAWNGHAQFNVLVDGHQIGGTQTATASHAAGQWQAVTLTGDFGATGPGHVSVQFLNDAWGGNANADRNLYVQSIDVNGKNFAGNLAANDAANGGAATDPHAGVMQINGAVDFNVNHIAIPAANVGDFWQAA